MLKLIRSSAASLLMLFLGIANAMPAQAGSKSSSTGSQVPITTTVTVLGPKFTAPPPLTKEDILVYSGKTRLQTINWVPAQAQQAPLQFAIVIDNSASQFGVGSQINDLAGFISLLSKSTAVGVFYAMDGTVQTASPFTTNHEAAAKSLRLPFGRGAGDSPSVYLSLSDLVKNRWPVTGARREVLLISSGVDRLDRGPQSPYVAASIEDVQKAGVEVHAIYTDGVHFGETLRGQFAQSNLIMLTEGSGGYNFFEGVSTPVSFSPFLKQLDMVLHNQYLMTFAIDRSKKQKGELRPIEIRTEQHNVDFKYPKQVFVPGEPKQ
jgi:hypothetical protein